MKKIEIFCNNCKKEVELNKRIELAGISFFAKEGQAIVTINSIEVDFCSFDCMAEWARKEKDMHENNKNLIESKLN